MKKFYSIILTILLSGGFLYAQNSDKDIEYQIQQYFNNYQASINIKQPLLKSINIDDKQKLITIIVSENFAYQPFTSQTVDKVYSAVKQITSDRYKRYKLNIITDDSLIEDLVPNAIRGKKKDKDRLFVNLENKNNAWVTPLSKPNKVSQGLQNSQIALWQSHGAYYINDKNKWGWQRPALFCTTEDLFTQSFVIPYIIPMLENAGAYVFTPRERSTQPYEVIVDNDINTNSLYIEEGSRKAKWAATNLRGFAQTKTIYSNGENPFRQGSARYAKTEKKSNKAFAEWIPTLPQSGSYPVYVSYQTLPNSVSDAKYIVFHKGGVTEFKINQQIGGGTWVYLGTFDFDKGNNQYGMVILSNESKEKGVVCADAVRFGGGMGNIVRGKSVSGYPRYLEGARYNAQWSGMPEDVYNGRNGDNDYIDDINTRSQMINYLSGGSIINPNQKGLGVPFEMCMAFHSDAGYNANDEIIGSLGIYTTDFNNKKLGAGVDRLASRDLADLLLTQIQQDILANHKLAWNRRAMWNRNYSETRIPSMASTIIEILSHQNFADMRLGHDPNFKFTLSRAIYKGTLKFLAQQYERDYVVQPLPVSHFSINFGKKKNTITLSWKPQEDLLEPTASAEEFIVYTAIGNQSFDNGTLVKTDNYNLKIEPGIIYSFKITAANKGGESFPSETLCAYISPNEEKRVLIVNGFDRLCAPKVINTPIEAGFDISSDPGIAYHSNISLCGYQEVFDRKLGGKEGTNALGYSNNQLEGKIIAGNTFDYPFIHGKAIQATGGHSFVSCSNEAVEDNHIQLESFNVIDLILGLEKDDASNLQYYKSFSSPLQRALTSYCNSGGNLLISGAYLASDMSESQGNKDFTEKVLKYRLEGTLTNKQFNAVNGLGNTLSIYQQPNEASYSVTTADCILPTDKAFSALAYSPGNESAGIAYKGSYSTFIMGFPFESIVSETQRSQIMASILYFFTQEKE